MTKPAQPSARSQETLQILQQAVAKALDRKRRLGQNAVVWKDGAPQILRADGEAATVQQHNMG